MSRTAILIPSLGRPQYVARVVGNIEQNTPEDHEQLWCYSGEEYEAAACVSDVPRIRDDDDPDKRYVTRMNKLVVWAVERGDDYVFFGSDDVVHHPFWLTNAINVMETAPGAQVVVVNDLRNPNGTQALVRTSYLRLAVFDDPAAAFHKGYQHNFADIEMFRTAQKRGVIYRAMDSHVEHLHPLFQRPTSRKWDDTYGTARISYGEDQRRFESRMKLMEEALEGKDW